MKKFTNRSLCPISTALDIFGDKWTLLIVRDIIFEGKSAYKEFMQSEEKIATNILANRLSILEAQGLVIKEKTTGNRSRYLYHPTPKAIALIPVIAELILWGNTYYPDTYTHPESLLAGLKTDKMNTIQAYTEKLTARLNRKKDKLD
ncbi:winged helix-turn-helix transcriptional regulator [Sinomicrobium weinanense]|uniref:Helix-turn-helix transcriptional regulator n=1 Tax=Sinomicrobium weinanense TaxID=2842200 RepID=A0A926JNB4_9FLAO|nr:helix-turn-helix domain-containing protein [Sinomicrobium weinanense]MBC9794447.1 helix-turn-helix transcriptional regulator [Sinomicrobium weinanense]MBU3124354.1 helix-turn-helix transcriptional regulator [Sinomicrobium weinanense]